METPRNSDPRERILKVADHLFYTDGVRATGTEKIMALAEVAKATFYRHFESKDALVLAYLDRRDRALWDFLAQPAPPADMREALIKFEAMANSPQIIGCPFLRVASEFPDTTHPFHLRVIEHKNKLQQYLADLLEPKFADRSAASAALLGIIDGALSSRMVYGTGRLTPILPSAAAVLASFQPA